MVLDAVAISIVSDGSFSQPVILTPHAGEMAQLTGHPKERVCADRQMAAVYAAWQWNTCVALKGAETFIATPEEDAWHFTGGGSGLATSGSGDAGGPYRWPCGARYGAVVCLRVGCRASRPRGGRIVSSARAVGLSCKGAGWRIASVEKECQLPFFMNARMIYELTLNFQTMAPAFPR